jgi:hypothetical protein
MIRPSMQRIFMPKEFPIAAQAKCPPPDSDPFSGVEFGNEFGKNPASLSRQFAESANCRFKLHERSQLLIRTHNETLPVVAVGVCNPDRSPVGINR